MVVIKDAYATSTEENGENKMSSLYFSNVYTLHFCGRIDFVNSFLTCLAAKKDAISVLAGFYMFHGKKILN